MRRVVIEEHFWSDALETNGCYTDGPSPFTRATMDEVRSRLTDFTEHRLPDMDRDGIDVQVLSLTAPGISMQPDIAVAVSDARRANDILAGVIRGHPDRFAGFATLALQDVPAAVVELERCIGELGFVGVLVNDHTLGHYLDEPVFEPLWDRLEHLGVPLYLHPSASFDQWHVLDGHPELQGATWAFQAATGGHAMRLVFGKVFDRHPDAQLILGHMGEFLPFQLSRFDDCAQSLVLPEPLDHPPSEYFGRNIAITTTGVFSHAVLLAAIAIMGIDNIMLSTDYPYDDAGKAVRFLDTAPIADSDRRKIAHANADRILSLTAHASG